MCLPSSATERQNRATSCVIYSRITNNHHTVYKCFCHRKWGEMIFPSFVMILFLTKLLHNNLHLILFEEEIRLVIREHCVHFNFQFKSCWKKLFSSSPAATAVPAPRVSLLPTGVGADSHRGCIDWSLLTQSRSNRFLNINYRFISVKDNVKVLKNMRT